MKRTVVTLALAALVLGGCSGKAESGDAARPADPAAAADTRKGGKGKPHVNPWAKEDPSAAVAATPAPARDAKQAAAKEAPKANPWAKEPPPGAPPAEPAKAAAK